MAILEHVNRDQLNIHQFQEAPEVRPELPFDVERDIDPDAKRAFLDSMENVRKQSLLDYSQYATIFKRLWPDQKLNLSETEKDAMVDLLIQEKRQISSVRTRIIQGLITTNPELYKELNLEDFDTCLKYAREWADAENYFAYTQDLFFLIIINPQGNYKLAEKEMNKLIAEISHFEQEGAWYEYMMAGSFLKILAPKHAIDITDETWDVLRKEIENRIGSVKFEMVVCLKILAAHKVEITAPGVMEFQMYPPSDLNQSAPPMPETRKF